MHVFLMLKISGFILSSAISMHKQECFVDSAIWLFGNVLNKNNSLKSVFEFLKQYSAPFEVVSYMEEPFSHHLVATTIPTNSTVHQLPKKYFCSAPKKVCK